MQDQINKILFNIPNIANKDVPIGKDDKSNLGTKMASSVGWDGVHLWVGEFKFSNRLLGFMPSR